MKTRLAVVKPLADRGRSGGPQPDRKHGEADPHSPVGICLILVVIAASPPDLPRTSSECVACHREVTPNIGVRVAMERNPDVFRHEQGCRDAVLAQMGQRTVAQLVKGALPSRCFREQKTTPAGRTAAPGRRGFDPARPGGSYSSGTKRLEKSTCCASAPAATFTKS